MNGVVTQNSGGDFLLEILYFIIAGLSCYSIYVIFDSFVNSGSGDSQNLEQVSTVVSVFYILTLFTSVYLFILLIRANHFSGDSNHIILFVLNSFLFFYGFISLIPSALAATDGAGGSIYAPVATSAISLVVALTVMVTYTSRGSGVFHSPGASVVNPANK